MSSIREKIMALDEPFGNPIFDDGETTFSEGFYAGLEMAADIAEAEVEGLLLGIKMLEARVRELEERYRDLETLDALSDMPCTCTVEQENGDDPTVCRSCSATHAYNSIWEEIRMYVQSSSE